MCILYCHCNVDFGWLCSPVLWSGMLCYIAWTISPEHFFHSNDAGYLRIRKDHAYRIRNEHAFAFICQINWAANINSNPRSCFWKRCFLLICRYRAAEQPVQFCGPMQ